MKNLYYFSGRGKKEASKRREINLNDGNTLLFNGMFYAVAQQLTTMMLFAENLWIYHFVGWDIFQASRTDVTSCLKPNSPSVGFS